VFNPDFTTMSFLPAKKQKRSGEGNTFKNGGLEFAA
jgi:hypothetical protein